MLRRLTSYEIVLIERRIKLSVILMDVCISGLIIDTMYSTMMGCLLVFRANTSA